MPPTKRSFYLSLATSALRFVIIVALVVGGVVVIGRAFPEGESAALPDGGSGPTESASPTTTPTTTPKPPPTPDLEGLEVAVFNGTSVAGLAADTAAELRERFGVDIPEDEGHIGDAPSPVETTTLYYRNAVGKVNAQELVDRFFSGAGIEAKVARLREDTSVERRVVVAIFLGNDYASGQP